MTKFCLAMFPKTGRACLGNTFSCCPFLVAKQSVPSLAIYPHSLGSPRQDLVFFRVVYNVPSCVCLSILWSGSRGLGTRVFLLSPFLCSLLFVSTFPIRGGKKCSDGSAQDEEEIQVIELPGGC
jgi:hypothetical protein